MTKDAAEVARKWLNVWGCGYEGAVDSLAQVILSEREAARAEERERICRTLDARVGMTVEGIGNHIRCLETIERLARKYVMEANAEFAVAHADPVSAFDELERAVMPKATAAIRSAPQAQKEK